MKFSALICDLDGTLVDSAAGILETTLALIGQDGSGTFQPPKDMASLIGPPVPEILARLLPDASREMVDRLNLRFRKLYDTTGWQNSRLYPGVLESLEILNQSGMKCFIVTNKPKLPTRLILGRLKINQYFLEVVSPDICNPAFSNKNEMLSYLIARHGLCPGECLMVGDSGQDGRAAQACHLAFAFVTYGYGKAELIEDFDPEFVLDRFDEIVPLILGA